MSAIAVVADDLTGSADTGVQFRRAGLPSRVWLADGQLGPGTTVFDTDSRSLPSADAAARVVSLSSHLRGAARVYKKVDSTLRGNVGAETEALLLALDRPIALLAPAFPANGRTTRQGVQFVAGVPVHRTAAASDPAHPMRHPTIADALRSQSRVPVHTLELPEVRRGSAHLTAHLKDIEGPALVVVDAEAEDDLATIAGAIELMGVERCLPVGSAGLAGVLAAEWSRGHVASAEVGAARHHDRVLVVCGSLNPATLAQAEQLEAERPEVRVLSSRLATEPSAAEVARAMAARVAAEVRESAPDALVLTGGDTARAVLAALGVEGIELDAELLPGVPLGRAIGGVVDGTTVVTKAGGFGPPDALVRVVRYLEEATA